MNKLFVIVISFCLMSLLLACKTASSEFVFYTSTGTTLPTIVLPQKPKGIEQKAAQLFVKNFEQITGKKLSVITENKLPTNATGVFLLIGNTIASDKLMQVNQVNADGFAFIPQQNKLYLVARQGMGLLYGVQAFFEKYTHMFYVDANEKKIHQIKEIIIPDPLWVSNPDFMFRSVYFPQSLDYDYNIWHGTHTIEEKWNVWGHNLHKLINDSDLQQDSEIYAWYQGKRNPNQFCFSSDVLFNALVNGIQQKILKNPDATYFSIAPNDNTLICSCDKCKSVNQMGSASGAVLAMVSKLAKKFPELFFTTLAYQTTSQVDTRITLPTNTAVFISTIDYPKGIPIQQTTQKAKFEHWVNQWKKVCPNIFVWDYTVQYTQYFIYFPNLKALQADLQWFKKLGITGVFEQGSDEHFSLFGDYKSYVISKLLWNSSANVTDLTYEFFENAYPANANALAEFVSLAEKNQLQSAKKLDIYGNVAQTMRQSISTSAFDLFYYELQDAYESTPGREKNKIRRIIDALHYLKLEQMRFTGFGTDGYADYSQSRILHKNVELALTSLNAAHADSVMRYLNEAKDDLATYCKHWEQYIIQKPYVNKIALQPVRIQPTYDEIQGVNIAKTFTNGTLGFTDYQTNWVIFSGNMEVEIPNIQHIPIKRISLSFLKDISHYIFLPEKVTVYGVGSSGMQVLQQVSLNNTPSTTKERVEVSLQVSVNAEQYTSLKIVSNNMPRLPDWVLNTTRKPTIACDEIQVE